MRQAIDLPHRGQARRLAAVAGGFALGAEEQQVLGEPLRDLGVPALENPVLRQQARGHSFAKHVEAEQAMGLRFVHRRGELPHRRDRARPGTGTEAGADVAHLRGGIHRLHHAHQRQQLAFERAVGRGVVLARCDLRIRRHLTPAPVECPQIGRVHTLGTGGFLHRPVLREQRQRRRWFAGQHARQVVEQRERGLFDVVNHRARQLVRLRDETLHRVFARAQHGRCVGQADQLERADTLVNLHARGAQHGGIDRIDIRTAERFVVLHEAAQGLVRRVERAAQLVLHPGQRTQVVV